MKAWQISCLGLSLSVLVFTSGCGVPSDKSLDESQKRIEILKSKGVPDSALSSATVFLYGAREAKAKENRALAQTSADSLRFLIGKAEADYEHNLESLKPAIDSLIRIISQDRNSLTGIQRKRIDSAANVIDSFYRINWIYQAQAHALKAIDLIKILSFNEERAKEIEPRLPGTWVCVNKFTSELFKEVKGEERIIFDFKKDKTGTLTQIRKGQSRRTLKEDVCFIYSGSYEIGGDTIYLHVNNLKSLKERFEEGVTDSTGKITEWRIKDNPLIDSTITDNSYERTVTFSDLLQDFKQEKKY